MDKIQAGVALWRRLNLGLSKTPFPFTGTWFIKVRLDRVKSERLGEQL
jgi:hypothetical protein